MSWLLIAIIAYFILALVNLTDKFLLQKFLPNHHAYTFLVGILGLLVWLLAPWWLIWSGWTVFSLNLLVGALFPIALLLMYKALKLGEASRIIPIMGGSIPIFILILSIFLLKESFTFYQWLAIILLLLGTIIISWFPDSHELWDKIKAWFRPEAENQVLAIWFALGAGLFFGLFFVGTKYLYTHQPFFSGFIWMRLGSFIAVLFLLIRNDYRKKIFKSLFNLKQKGRIIFLINQLIAAVGFLLQNYAVSLASVALVSALQGVEYAFLLIFGALLSLFFPQIVKENISKAVIIQKAIAIILISLGLYFIAI